jgi:hypothetical protein
MTSELLMTYVKGQTSACLSAAAASRVDDLPIILELIVEDDDWRMGGPSKLPRVMRLSGMG